MTIERDWNISEHFTYFEMTRTDKPEYAASNRETPPHLMVYAHALCWGLLEPLRNFADAPVIIHSGYRSSSLNEIIGGSPTSQHVRFQAADFTIKGQTLNETFTFVQEIGLPFGQLILEPKHIHISLGWPVRDFKWRDVMVKENGVYTVVRKIEV